MKSSIKIDVLHDNRPVINVKRILSDDPRDKLVDNFFKTLGYTSSWLKVDFSPVSTDENGDNVQGMTIYSIPPQELKAEMDLIKERIADKQLKNWDKK